MIVTTITTLAAAGLAGYSYLNLKGSGTSEAHKIQQIFKNAGWRTFKEITKRIAPVPIISFLSSNYALAGPQEVAPEVVEVVAQSTRDSIVHAFDPRKRDSHC